MMAERLKKRDQQEDRLSKSPVSLVCGIPRLGPKVEGGGCELWNFTRKMLPATPSSMAQGFHSFAASCVKNEPRGNLKKQEKRPGTGLRKMLPARASIFPSIFQTAKDVDSNTMILQYVDALKSMAQGESTKFIIPLEFTKFASDISSIVKNEHQNDGKAPEKRCQRGGGEDRLSKSPVSLVFWDIPFGFESGGGSCGLWNFTRKMLPARAGLCCLLVT